MEQRIANLVEQSGFDKDHMLAPKNLWPSNQARQLKDWLDGRKEVAEA